MATCVWKGGAAAVSQLDTITVSGTWATNDTATITINGQSLTFTVGATQTAAAVVTGLVALWNASTIPECEEVTAADGAGDTITLTADTAGVPFTITVSVVTAGDGDMSIAHTTANAGPNDWSTAANWSGGAVPVDDDTIIIEKSDVSILYGLDQSAITPDAFTIRQDFTGTIGLPTTNETGTYPEYREQYLKISPDVITIGGGDGDGSGRIKINTGLVQTALTILNSGTGLDDGLHPIQWKGTHASNAVSITKGQLDIAPYAAEVATFTTLKQGYLDNIEGDSTVRCGSGVTCGTITKNGGQLTIDTTAAAVTAVTQLAGELKIEGSTNAVTALTIYGGAVFYNTSGTLTAGIVGTGAVLDFRQDMRAKTVTAISIYAGGAAYDPAAVVTWTNGLDLVGAGLEDCTLELGTHRTWTPTAI